MESTKFAAILAILSPVDKTDFENTFWQTQDVGIEHVGTKITLPAEPHKMTMEAAVAALQQKIKDENQIMDLIQQVEGYPYDAAVAFVKAMQRKYGWASPIPTPGFFGPTPPTLLTVRTGPKPTDTIQVPMGSFLIPGVENPIMVHLAGDHNPTGQVVLCIHGKARKREKNLIMELVALTQQIMKEESIYKGKALRLKVKPDGTLDRNLEPLFLETDHVQTGELVLSRPLNDQLNVSLFTPIRETAACTAHGIPLKRGILLEGPYGVGKSMTAAVTSKVCVDNGWTYILLDKVQGLKAALEFAREYQPAVVFAEDIDRVTAVRDDKANDLLNTIDGVLNKDAKVITVLSTNHVDMIQQAMLRPGRLDAVISMTAPDAEAASRLILMYGRGLVRADEPLGNIGKELAGQIPATIREVVERSKLAMIMGKRSMIIEDDLMIAAEGMKKHLDLLKPRDATPTDGETLAAVLGRIVKPGDSNSGAIEDIKDKLNDLSETAGVTYSKVSEIKESVESIEMPESNGSLSEEVSEKLDAIHKTQKKIEKFITT